MFLLEGIRNEDCWDDGAENNAWNKSQIWRKLQNVYLSPNIIRVMKPRRVRWVSHVACIGETREANRI